MALTAAEIITLVKITRQSRATVQASADGADADLETALRADVVKWDANEDKVKVKLTGRVDMSAQRLLDAIRVRVCDLLGFPVPGEGGGCSSLPGSVVLPTSVGW